MTRRVQLLITQRPHLSIIPHATVMTVPIWIPKKNTILSCPKWYNAQKSKSLCPKINRHYIVSIWTQK